jgi:hypothetical protein
MSEFNKEAYLELQEAQKIRFSNAQFSISCFKAIDEIENKVLSYDDVIIYNDSYIVNRDELRDYFIVTKKINKEAIYYCDVIDELINKNFRRNDCDHKYLETIKEYNTVKRNNNSIKIFASFWGS